MSTGSRWRPARHMQRRKVFLLFDQRSRTGQDAVVEPAFPRQFRGFLAQQTASSSTKALEQRI